MGEGYDSQKIVNLMCGGPFYVHFFRVSIPKNLFDCQNHTVCVPPLLRQRIFVCNERGIHTMLKDVIYI